MLVDVDQGLLDTTYYKVRHALLQKVSRPSGSPVAQPFAVDALGFLVLQVALPIVVSLCSSALYDLLKNRKASALRERQLNETLEALKGRTANTEAPLSLECMELLAEHLAPLGFSATEIHTLNNEVKLAIQPEAS
jgi:hypothetical protein